MRKKIFILAGEASGDLHGKHLIEELKNAAGDRLEIHGVGGDHIRDTGALGFYDLARFHATGLTQAICKIPLYRRAEKILLDSLKRVRPDLVVLIDNPGFNFHIGKKINRLGIPIVYYVSPQLWAWAPQRVFEMKRFVQKVLVFFEFEKDLYEKHAIPVSFVGHPLKDLIAENERRAWTEKEKRIALMPGSRKGELEMLLPAFLGAAEKIARLFPLARFFLVQSPTQDRSFYERLLGRRNVKLEWVTENRYETIGSCDLALVCSGTATLECALLGVPMIISNRGSFLTYVFAKLLIRVPFLGLPNIVLGRSVCPELLQQKAAADPIAAEAVTILSDRVRWETMKRDLREVSSRLGSGGASRRAAEEVLKTLGL